MEKYTEKDLYEVIDAGEYMLKGEYITRAQFDALPHDERQRFIESYIAEMSWEPYYPLIMTEDDL